MLTLGPAGVVVVVVAIGAEVGVAVVAGVVVATGLVLAAVEAFLLAPETT